MNQNIHKLNNVLPPTVLTIFGATGDLSANYLLPAIFHMHVNKLLPKDFQLICVGRKELDAKSFLEFVMKKSSALKKYSSVKHKNSFLKHLVYFQGDLEKPESFLPLAEIISGKTKQGHKCANLLYYFATSPALFARIAEILKTAGLLLGCTGHERHVRVLVEKPFGEDLVSAKALNSVLLKYFNEEQIYRIDHYQGKETVQNLIVARFANSLFEPLWNKENIDHVEISVLYNDTVGHRAEFYQRTGALKDAVQNHALMMLSLTLMDEPLELTTENLRNEKFKILNALRPFNGEMLKKNIIKGQYDIFEKEIGNKSTAETFVALKTFVDLPRWQDVPIYIRTGKALKDKITEISVHFKELPRCLFRGCAANVLTFRIQPDESVRLVLNNKIPGFGINLHQAHLNFSYDTAFKGELPSAYERLLLDFMEGDQRLFIRSDEIEASWRFIDSITENWSKLPMYKYKTGSTGPKEADDFIKKDLRDWWTQ